MNALEVQNLSKKYTITHQQESYAALRDQLTLALKNPLGFLQRRTGNERKEEFWALRDISFHVTEGEVLGIIGPNGAGKSTLLKILSRITPPTSGHIKLQGRVASLLEVGSGFHPELTGRENIFLNASILGMKKREIVRKLDDIVQFSGVEKFIDTPVKRYSSGMYVRLAFAIAAHIEPDILLVDEVLAVGDAEFQKKCLGKMEGVTKQEGRTILFVSHNVTAIRTLCDRAILLKNGEIVASDSSSEIIRLYEGHTKESILVREWSDEKTAPQNESALLRKVSICNSQGSPLSEVYTDTPFQIEIEFETKVTNAFVGITAIVYDKDHHCVLSSVSNHEVNWYGKSMPRGIYKSICEIPANFFNQGIFHFSLNLFGKNFSDPCMVYEVCQIEIFDSSTVRGDYYGEWKGVVRPLLSWRTYKLEDALSS